MLNFVFKSYVIANSLNSVLPTTNYISVHGSTILQVSSPVVYFDKEVTMAIILLMVKISGEGMVSNVVTPIVTPDPIHDVKVQVIDAQMLRGCGN
ncbi:hypothetical protein DM860_012348 [Cuscuta australis]|uniref:Uncharacterized protein n=1 Tax=Cuscuta australis TaxID=267555 RepID=A0A328DUI5_9ASTE|nr:hypothetical protein DM860_012348 [Cuscuta australis]